jgi:glucoamylase
MTGAKNGVGTSADAASRVWFTITRGILSEVFFPRTDCANTRDLRLIVTGDDDYFSDEWSDTRTSVHMVEDGIPAYIVHKECNRGRYDLEKTIIADPDRSVVLQRFRFQSRDAPGRLRTHVLLSPHIGNQGDGNDGWFGDYKGLPMLFARRGITSLALATSARIIAADCDHVGEDDAWHELRSHFRLRETRPHAHDGNIMLAAELDLAGGGGEAVIALAFGADYHAAGAQARASLIRSFDDALAAYVEGWRRVQARARPINAGGPTDAQPRDGSATLQEYRASIAILRALEDKTYPGGMIASLAIPWGEARGDQDRGGYHLVWPRDAVECAGGMLAAGFKDSAGRTLLHLIATQEDSGNWPQNMWLNGRAHWHGVQLDETALPVLLADLLARHDALDGIDPWPTIRRAADYLVRNGPATPEDRWELEGGFSPFTLAVEISALLIVADAADAHGEPDVARYLRQTADAWNDSIERWTYCTGGSIAEKLGIEGYYVRRPPTAPKDGHSLRNASSGHTDLRFARHRVQSTEGDSSTNGNSASDVIGLDALALVRFGLRRADDSKIGSTARAIDSCLRRETRTGPVWRRFQGDRYGESENGVPMSNAGIGRGWPLLTGERAHYELARGNLAGAKELRCAMIRQAGECGMLPEQIWDADDIPDRHLFNGRPSGSAMPLAWAHAEFVKLCRSIEDGSVFDMPPQTLARYAGERRPSPIAIWRQNARVDSICAGQTLRIEGSKGEIVYRVSGSEARGRVAVADFPIGPGFADLPTEQLAAGAEIRFGFAPSAQSDAAEEFSVRIDGSGRDR